MPIDLGRILLGVSTFGTSELVRAGAGVAKRIGHAFRGPDFGDSDPDPNGEIAQFLEFLTGGGAATQLLSAAQGNVPTIDTLTGANRAAGFGSGVSRALGREQQQALSSQATTDALRAVAPLQLQAIPQALQLLLQRGEFMQGSKQLKELERVRRNDEILNSILSLTGQGAIAAFGGRAAQAGGGTASLPGAPGTPVSTPPGGTGSISGSPFEQNRFFSNPSGRVY